MGYPDTISTGTASNPEDRRAVPAILHTAWARVHRSKAFVLSVLVIIVLGRILLPTLLLGYVNRTLDRLPEFRGNVGDLSVQLFRGAYRLQDVRINKITGKVPVPYFRADAIDFSVEWSALVHGKIVGELVIEQGQLNFVNARSDSAAQTEVNPEWLSVIKDLFPLRINRAELINSEIHFRDFESIPRVDVELARIQAVAANFSNTRSPSEGLVASFHAQALAQRTGHLSLDVRLHPSASKPTFDLDGQLTGLKMTALNDFLRAYAYLDAEAGTVGFYVEMAARDGKATGYVKPMIENLHLLKLRELGSSPIKTIWESVIGFIAEIFTNHHTEQLASKIPFQGQLSGPKVEFWSAFASMFRNAFVKALQPRLDNRVTLESVDSHEFRK